VPGARHRFCRRRSLTSDVGRKATKTPLLIVTLGSALALSTSCSTPSGANAQRPVVDLQLQKSVTLAAGRYAEILKDIERGDTQHAKDDADWWLDQSIIELQWLEERLPVGRWESVPVADMPNMQMKTLYRSIARSRRDHPRHHSVPIEPATLKRIDDFVRKYQ